MEDGTSKSPCYSGTTEAHQWDYRSDCAVRKVLDRVADRWSVLVLAYLAEGAHRFGELGRRVDGVSRRVLAATLRQLERDGLVLRTVHPTVPPRVDYELTPLGETLHTALGALVTWADAHEDEVAAARAAFDARSGAA